MRLRAQEALSKTSYSVNAKLIKNIGQKWNICLKDAHERTRRRGGANLSVDTTAVQLCNGNNIKDEFVPRNDSSKIIVSFDNKLSLAHDNIPISKKRKRWKSCPSYYCCFENCKSNNVNHDKFHRVPPVPPKPKREVLEQYITYHSKSVKRKEFLDMCGLKRNISASNYRICSQHTYKNKVVYDKITFGGKVYNKNSL